MAPQNNHSNYLPSVRTVNERAMGITHYVSPMDSGLQGDMRKRFTDFLVYEIRKDGRVVHLQDYEDSADVKINTLTSSVPEKALENDRNKASALPSADQVAGSIVSPISGEDRSILEDLIGEETAKKLIDMDTAILNSKSSGKSKLDPVLFPVIAERPQRAVTHKEIRRIFASRIDTRTDDSGVITAVPLTNPSSGGRGNRDNPRNNRSGNRSYGQLGGEHLHFTLFKENKDTMDAINHIARMLKIKSSNFGFAGTKDRRAATVQRVSVSRQRAENLIWLNHRVPGIKVGDFEYHPYPMTLGQHGGNQFVITLKNCQVTRGAGCSLQRQFELIEQAVEVALGLISKHGFINYFGLQRFGTHTVGTHELGTKILLGDFEAAVLAILHVDAEFYSANLLNDGTQEQPANRDEVSRAKAIGIWKTTGDAELALKILPKRYSAETNIIRHLSRPETKKDFVGALLTITRGMRMMYIHAYQSFVWNHVASYRWSKFGSKVMEGDLVLEDSDELKPKATGDDMPDPDQEDEHFYARARVLSAEEAASGRYTISDVVLPTPGYDVDYPENDVGQFYTEFMGREENGGLNPYEMRRRQREFSLSGNYRHLIGRFIGEPAFSIRVYSDDTEQMYPTDADIINQRKEVQRAIRREQLEKSTPAVAAWNNLARNVQVHDELIGRERRRFMDSQPTPEGGTRIRDTWVEHTLDGSNKRVKVEKHVYDMTWGSRSGEAKMEFSDEPDPSWDTNLGEGQGSAQPLNHQQNDVKKSSEAFPGSEDKSFSCGSEIDTRFCTGGARLGISKDAEGQAGPTREVSMQPVRAVSGGLGASSLQGLITATDPSSATEHRRSMLPKPLTFPKFRVPGQEASAPSGISPVSDSFPEKTDSPGQPKKIAVTLKFGLRSSNYATIALREIMGASREDSQRVDASKHRADAKPDSAR